MWRSCGAGVRAVVAHGLCRVPPTALCSVSPQDLAVPNAGWSVAMREQFQHLLRRAADGSWRRIPSYRRGLDHLPEVLQMVVGPVTGPGPRLFLRNLDAEGAGFEYAIFLHASGHRTQCLCQLGPYLEGHHGFAHGGAIATLIDTTVGTCALAVAKTSVVTAKLSISYLAPMPVGAVVVADSCMERHEGRKIFLSCHVRDTKGDTLYAEATALFIQVEDTKPSLAACP
ncbi:acyl-coenzyme A thioesterase THEM4-like [Centrocercus urophasianus]|uniref:acyl-coenzyme A thioesterase THEM4-like n=2 Tax=Tetraoninae TaxID=466585 RepID=UPI001C64DF19|nr:acyl-coenzyme A thioesterase THEM4-like [Centrocercus urophasianus]XP_052520996.1 acyl-coenzyme A thioesterase THEM4-like isoform X1 [Tympanuchus pallidicinctus]